MLFLDRKIMVIIKYTLLHQTENGLLDHFRPLKSIVMVKEKMIMAHIT